ncbi:MAG: ATP-binding protein [Lachnospiraceae bacterium]|nr:ATP-binding protein [Lachnospiraceae bacterium]
MLFTEEVYDEIMQVYYTNQNNNRAIEEERKEEIYRLIPRIKEIEQSIAVSSIDAVRARLKGNTDRTDAVKDSNKTLIEEKKKLLVEHGYPEDYLNPIYTCPICHDTGRTGTDYCSCFKQATITMLYRQSTLSKILESENFDTFNLDYYPKESDGIHPYTPWDNMNNILNKAKDFVENFDKNGGNMLFYGDTGLGKSFMSNCIAKALMDTRHTVLYQSAIHLFEEVCGDAVMNKTGNPKNKEIYDYLYRCDLLIIDDLGTEFTNSFVASELYNILNTRMRENKSTVISTNLNLQEINDRYSDRISTRILAEYKVYNFYGSNVRLAKRRNSIKNN